MTLGHLKRRPSHSFSKGLEVRSIFLDWTKPFESEGRIFALKSPLMVLCQTRGIICLDPVSLSPAGAVLYVGLREYSLVTRCEIDVYFHGNKPSLFGSCYETSTMHDASLGQSTILVKLPANRKCF